jgi:hypothetical protein
VIRAHKLTARPLTARKLIAYKLGQSGPFDPLILFRNAETGTFLDFTSSQVYADTAGTDPAEVGEGIAFVDDRSPNDVDATQSTSTARPIFGRVPVGGARNFQTFSQDFTQWTTPQEFSGNSSLGLDGTMSASKISRVSGGSDGTLVRTGFVFAGAGITRTLSVYAKHDGVASLGTLSVVLDHSGTGGYPFGGSFSNSIFDTVNGTVIQGVNVTATIEDAGDGWWRCSVSSTTTVSGTATPGFSAPFGSAVILWGAQFEEGLAPSPYQKVVTQHDITEAGVPSIYKSFFDKSDDILPITLPTITGGTVALVGTSGIWIEDDWDFTAGTLNIGPTTIAGLPAGILSVVGDLCAVIINDRAWTAAERAGVIAWGKARGAPGVFELGPELVTNGTFDTDVSGWTGVRSAILSSVSGELNVEGGGTTFPSAVQDISGALVEGVSYNVTCVLTADSASAARIFIGNSIASTPYSTIVEVPVSTTASVEFSFAASSDAASLGHIIVGHKGATVGEISTFDNVSMRAFELLP